MIDCSQKIHTNIVFNFTGVTDQTIHPLICWFFLFHHFEVLPNLYNYILFVFLYGYLYQPGVKTYNF